MRPDADNPRAWACIAALLAQLAKKVNNSAGPIHAAPAIRKFPRSADSSFKVIEYRIEPDQICASLDVHFSHVTLVSWGKYFSAPHHGDHVYGAPLDLVRRGDCYTGSRSMATARDSLICSSTNVFGLVPTSIPNSLHSLKILLTASLVSLLLLPLTTSTVKIGS